MDLSSLKAPKRKTKRRVGRGDASGAGTYSGRGNKGQRSRSGGKGGLKYKGLKMSLTKLPKLKGFKSYRKELDVINLKDLESNYKEGATVELPGVKVLGQGELKKKLEIKASGWSKSAEDAIIKAGGTITKFVFPKKKKKEKK